MRCRSIRAWLRFRCSCVTPAGRRDAELRNRLGVRLVPACAGMTGRGAGMAGMGVGGGDRGCGVGDGDRGVVWAVALARCFPPPT